MERDPLLDRDELKIKILGFLQDHIYQSYTTKEIIDELHFYSLDQKNVQGKIEEMLRQGLIRVQRKGRESGYQIIPGRIYTQMDQ